MGSLTINPSLHSSLRYDPVKSFEPITLTHNTSNLLVVNPNVPARSVAELIELARKKPGELVFASDDRFSGRPHDDDVGHHVQLRGVRQDRKAAAFGADRSQAVIHDA